MEIGFGLVITLIGMAVVFLTLVALMGIVRIPGAVSRLFQIKRPRESVLVESDGAETPPQHIAAITAAVAMLGASYRVRTIEIIGNDNWERSRYTDIATL
ncbi:MAG: OadG family protein [Eubacteriales bacterium]|nr:OadG family protein [Eubacteriales bacterium]MDD3074091.1 OadG family protein [Eubacteriales bacterium]MDD4079013.1 OadG family protein [Eubacteriales bacterium]MDD4768794.1 OadG family protein [Eubacteriales bacterium]